jgi:RDD family.
LGCSGAPGLPAVGRDLLGVAKLNKKTITTVYLVLFSIALVCVYLPLSSVEDYFNLSKHSSSIRIHSSAFIICLFIVYLLLNIVHLVFSPKYESLLSTKNGNKASTVKRIGAYIIDLYNSCVFMCLLGISIMPVIESVNTGTWVMVINRTSKASWDDQYTLLIFALIIVTPLLVNINLLFKRKSVGQFLVGIRVVRTNKWRFVHILARSYEQVFYYLFWILIVVYYAIKGQNEILHDTNRVSVIED